MKIKAVVMLSFITLFCTAQTGEQSFDEFDILYNAGIYKEAVAVGHFLEKNYIESNELEYARFLDRLAECEYEMEDYSSAKQHLDNALKVKKKLCGKNSIDYANTLRHLADCHYYMELTDATHLAKKAFHIARKKNGNKSPEYYDFLVFYAEFLDNDECEALIEYSINKIDTTCITYANALSTLANCCFETGRHGQAINLYRKSLEIRERIEGLYHPHVAKNLEALSICYSYIDAHSIAVELLEQANSIYYNCYGENTRMYLYSLSGIASIKAKTDSYGEAIALSKEALNIAKEEFGKMSFEYAYILRDYSSVLYYAEDIEGALESRINANEIIKSAIGETNYEYINGLYELALCYYDVNDSIALTLIREYNTRAINEYGENSFFYARGLLYYSKLLLDHDCFQEGVRNAKKAINLFSGFDDRFYLYEGLLWERLTSYYLYCKSDIDSACYTQKKALESYEKQIGDNSGYYISTLGSYAELLCQSGKYEEGLQYEEMYIKQKKEWILSVFSQLEEKNRYILWNSYATNSLVLKICQMAQNTSKAKEIAYNIALFNKSLLLNTEISVREVGKKQLLLLDNYSRCTSSYELDILEKLKNEFDICWQDVQNSLHEGQMAIEFVSISSNDSLVYYALTIKPKFQYPKMIRLFESNKLKTINPITLYDSLTLYNLIWKPLDKELDSVNTIYFSPDKDIHNIAIESAMTPKGQRISDCYDIHRLSSTREIAKINENGYPKTVVLYGGLDYFADSCDIIAANKVNGVFDKGASCHSERIIVNDNSGTVGNLIGSGREVNSIATILSPEYSCQLFTGQLGTEESFKALSGDNFGIIHISTHGYYWSESTFNNRKSQNKIRIADKDLTTEEDKALMCTGLYFAGVNTTLAGEKLPVYLDDGILTAQEISELDLNGTDMVVLSACQTGLGDLKDDGVFGLQRGFKKAGVKSILMSLWKVDDNATELLMVEFYRNYLAGIGKTQSLKNAQKFVREYTDVEGNRIYEHPYYWAGFIMLD